MKSDYVGNDVGYISCFVLYKCILRMLLMAFVVGTYIAGMAQMGLCRRN